MCVCGRKQLGGVRRIRSLSCLGRGLNYHVPVVSRKMASNFQIQVKDSEIEFEAWNCECEEVDRAEEGGKYLIYTKITPKPLNLFRNGKDDGFVENSFFLFFFRFFSVLFLVKRWTLTPSFLPQKNEVVM